MNSLWRGSGQGYGLFSGRPAVVVLPGRRDGYVDALAAGLPKKFWAGCCVMLLLDASVSLTTKNGD